MLYCSESIYDLQYNTKTSDFQNFIAKSMKEFLENDWGLSPNNVKRYNEEQFESNKPIIGIYEFNNIYIGIILEKGHKKEKNYYITLKDEIEDRRYLNFKIISQTFKGERYA